MALLYQLNQKADLVWRQGQLSLEGRMVEIRIPPGSLVNLRFGGLA